MVATEKLVEELKSIRDGAGLYDASAYGQFLAAGADAPSFLHRMLSNEVQKLKIGEGRYQGLLDRKAMVLSLFYLRRLSEREFLGVTPPQLTQKTIGALAKMKFIEKVAISDVSKERGLLFVVGPQAEPALEAAPKAEKLLVWKDEGFKLPWFCVSGPKEEIAGLAATLSGKTVPIGDTALRLVKMAAGFPEYGVDLDESRILLEAALPYTYQRNKGCYPGQEVVERISAYGKGKTPKRLTHFTLPGERVLTNGADIVTKEGVKVGSVTSSLFNPLDGVTQVMAYLETKYVDEALADIGQCQFLAPPPL
jgi:folate-binding protein YgfZ